MLENKDTANKLLDVRREQRLSYHAAWLLSACVAAVPAHVNAAVVPLPFAMRRKYKFAWWSVELPDDWEAEPDEDCVTFASERGVGALQISAYRRDAEKVTHEDLLEFAEDELAKDETPHSASCGEFVGLETSYFSDESFWRKLWLRSGSLLLFVTYTCAAKEREVETKDVNQILESISVK